METLRIANTQENKNHLQSTNRSFTEDGRFLLVDLNAYERTMAADKKRLKKALGL